MIRIQKVDAPAQEANSSDSESDGIMPISDTRPGYSQMYMMIPCAGLALLEQRAYWII